MTTPHPATDGAVAPVVTVRYWAGAAAAAGTETDQVHAARVGEAVDAVVALHPALAPVAPVCALLLDGTRAERDTQVPAGGATLELLPPFAGG